MLWLIRVATNRGLTPPLKFGVRITFELTHSTSLRLARTRSYSRLSFMFALTSSLLVLVARCTYFSPLLELAINFARDNLKVRAFMGLLSLGLYPSIEVCFSSFSAKACRWSGLASESYF
jgi:hypothetical protein